MSNFFQIKVCQKDQNPIEEGFAAYTRYANINDLKPLAENLIKKEQGGNLDYYIVLYDLDTRLPISYYRPFQNKEDGTFEWVLFENISDGHPPSLIDVLFDRAFNELDIEFDYATEVLKAKQSHLRGTRVHKKHPKNSLDVISDEDIARMRAKFLK